MRALRPTRRRVGRRSRTRPAPALVTARSLRRRPAVVHARQAGARDRDGGRQPASRRLAAVGSGDGAAARPGHPTPRAAPAGPAGAGGPSRRARPARRAVPWTSAGRAPGPRRRGRREPAPAAAAARRGAAATSPTRGRGRTRPCSRRRAGAPTWRRASATPAATSCALPGCWSASATACSASCLGRAGAARPRVRRGHGRPMALRRPPWPPRVCCLPWGCCWVGRRGPAGDDADTTPLDDVLGAAGPALDSAADAGSGGATRSRAGRR